MPSFNRILVSPLGSLKRPFPVWVIGGLLWFLFAAQPFAADQKANEAKLKNLKKDIALIESRLEKDRQARSTAEKKLTETEQSIGLLNKKIYLLDEKLKGLKTNLKGFQSDREQLEQRIQDSQEQLYQLLRHQYRAGQNPRLFMLLNQRDPEQVSRMMAYYDRFSAAQLKQLEIYRSLLNSLADTHESIDLTEQDILHSRQSLHTKLVSLESLRSQRKLTIATLKKQINNDQSKLARYQADKKRLAKVIQELAKRVSLADLKQNNQAFRSLKGKLKWPVKGTIRRGFGSKQNGVSFDGMLISSKAGTKVRAIHHGRVVFSDWLRGYGLLTIIDHGEGYMSLYGQNDSVLKEPGEWVSQGETIATVGSSGGNSYPGLYFAIRHKGQSTNPKSWMVRR